MLHYVEKILLFEDGVLCRKDGVIIWDSLGKTSDSSISHQAIGLEHIYLEVQSRISSHNLDMW